MKTPKLPNCDPHQAVNLPKSFRFEGSKIYIKEVSSGLLLLPKASSLWNFWEEQLLSYAEPLISDRNQPLSNQQRARV